MAIRTKEEILELFRNYIGDRADEATIGLLEDLSDTLSDLDVEELKGRLDKAEQDLLEQDTIWRNRYRDRFFSSVDTDDRAKVEATHGLDNEPVTTFESLFKEG